MSTEAFHAAMSVMARTHDEVAAHLESCESATDRPTAEDMVRLADLLATYREAWVEAANLAGFELPL